MRTNHCHWVRRMGLLVLAAGLTLSVKADLASLFTNLNATKPAPGRPHRCSIIFIQCDSLGYLDLSCYGQKQFATPNLDRLAAGGMLFTNYDALGADGPTTRAAMLTGKAPDKSYLTADATTVAQILQASGYHTGMIGEWNFGGQDSISAPWHKGFDEFAGYYDSDEADNYYADVMWRYAPMSHFDAAKNQYETYIGKSVIMHNEGDARQQYIPDLYTMAAMKFVKNNRPYYANHYRPFFLWLNYVTPRPNRAEAARTGDGMEVPTDAPYSEEAWPQAEKNRAAMITRLDADIGRLVDRANKLGLSNNLAIFFSSACAPQKTGGVDPMFFPSVVSTNDVRLPMIAYWPGHIRTNQVSALHWSPGNFLATAAEIAMADYPTNDVQPPILRTLYGLKTTNNVAH